MTDEADCFALEQTMFSAPFSNQLARALIMSSPDPIIVFDSDWQILALNNAAETILNCSSADIIGRAYMDVTPHAEIEAILRACRSEASWRTENKVYQPQLFHVGEDSPNGWVTVLRDITQIDKLNRSQNEFIRLVSHDLRSPLTSIQGFASMLDSAGSLNEKQTYFVEKVLSGIAQMTALIENIQDAGRFDPETGFYEMTRTPCDVGGLVQRIVADHLVPAEKQELALSVNVIDPLPIINADNLMLERAITNLIDNAIKFTPNGGSITVHVLVQNGALVIGVEDTGLGISADDQKLLFQRHVRLVRKEHQRKVKGSGLGLFIVRSVAQRHHGDAWVVSEPGKGSTFYFSIPLSDANLIAQR
jgi:two-component system phosphate regulon sensor histidine kinase PhoR